MCSDPTLPEDLFRHSPQWQLDPLSGRVDDAMATRYSRGKENVDGQVLWHSFSGHERNCLFLNESGERFQDLSAVSGADSIADGRAFALWDYDHDGWRDIALTNANWPLMELYRNRFRDAGSTERHFLAIRFVGGNRQAQVSHRFSSRDAYGVKVSLRVGDMQIVRELRCGEGFAAQNSDTLLVGIGKAAKIGQLTVTWPSGIVTKAEDVDTDELLIAYEDSEAAPGKTHFQSRPYVPVDHSTVVHNERVNRLVLNALPVTDSSDFHLIVTTATWCAACKRQLPQLERLREAFPRTELGLWAVPADAVETAAEWTAYVAEYRPAYQLLADIDAPTRELVLALVRQETKSAALPASILLDRNGRVLQVIAGVPSVSEVGRVADARRVPSARE